MNRLSRALLFWALIAAPAAAPAGEDLCASDDPALIWSACAGDARAGIRLLPEDAAETPEDALDVTGGYTAEDQREGGKPKPVGLFIRKGEIVNREYVRFDGLLVVDAQGRPEIQHRRRASWGGARYDLDDADRRAAFLAAVAKDGGSLLQSHLLIIDGAVDAHPQDGAPSFRRRILFTDRRGDFGLWDSSPVSLTLAEAAEELDRRHAPRMALNLDMGSFDFCRKGAVSCGLLGAADTAKLSNLLRLTLE